MDYENTINSLLVEKVGVEVENKRLLRQIELSEKKLGHMGQRLINLARERAEYDSEEEEAYL